MAVQNSTILSKAWIEGSNDFQQRIPNPDIAGYAAAVQALFDPYNGDLLNGFSNLLVGFMGNYVESKLFENPLRELKKPAAEFGNTERHVAVKYMKAHSYKLDDETLLKLEKPEFQEWFYSVNQHRRYEFSWSRYELSRVMSEGSGYGLDNLLAATLDQQRSSDNYDEMQVMINTFAMADKYYSLYRRNITAAPTTKELGQELLVKIRTDAGMMQFPSMRYNQIDVPVFESPRTLVLWVTPETDAYLDVMALAELFHVERAEVNFRKIIVPEFPIPNVYAALTSEDFIYARDVWYGIEPPFYNPANRTYKYYLFHDQMIGMNPAANCVLYTTDTATTIPTIKMAATGMTITPKAANVPLGGSIKLDLALTGSVTPTGTPIALEPDAATYTVAATHTEGSTTTPVTLNSRTRVTPDGVLHVQRGGNLAVGDKIVVTATTAYKNPSASGETNYTATFTGTVVAAEEETAKESFVETNSNLVYTPSGDDVTYKPTE